MMPGYDKMNDGSDAMEAVEKLLSPDEFRGFLKGNILKYVIRYRKKNGIVDLYKAEDYLTRLADWEAEHGYEKEER